MNPDSLISLTDLWKASGLGDDRKPAQWLRWAQTKEFIEKLKVDAKGVGKHLLKIKPGKGGGTFGHWQIALSYTSWLSLEMQTKAHIFQKNG